MIITFWGVRGSIPSPGPATVRYGGNTPCVSVSLSGGEELMFDCGTGARNFGNALMSTPFGKGQGKMTVVLSHAQWDHIQGFPFFRPFYIPGNRFTVVGARSASDLQTVLEGQMAAQYFPVQTYRNMASAIELVGAMDKESVSIGDASLRACSIPGGPPGAAGYRLQDGKRAIAYIGHGSPDGSSISEILDLCRGVDLLIHECTFTPEDSSRYPNRQLVSLDQTLDTAIGSGAKKLALMHYDQDYTDVEVDALVARARAAVAARGSKLEVIGAAEGLTLKV